MPPAKLRGRRSRLAICGQHCKGGSTFSRFACLMSYRHFRKLGSRFRSYVSLRTWRGSGGRCFLVI